MGTNIANLFEEISIKLLERHKKMLAAGGGKGKYKMNDPTQNVSFNYNQTHNNSRNGG